MRKRPGRKSLCTPRRRKVIVKAIRKGATIKIAAGAAGVGERTLYRWLAEGEVAKRGPKRQLWHDLKDAESAAALEALEIIQAAAWVDWKAAGWYLERRFGYIRRQHVDLEGQVEHTSQGPDLSRLSLEDVQALARWELLDEDEAHQDGDESTG